MDDTLIIALLILLFKENNTDYSLYLILAVILLTK